MQVEAETGMAADESRARIDGVLARYSTGIFQLASSPGLNHPLSGPTDRTPLE